MFCHLNYMDVTVLADKLAVDTSVIVFLTCDYLGMLNPQNAIWQIETFVHFELCIKC